MATMHNWQVSDVWNQPSARSKRRGKLRQIELCWPLVWLVHAVTESEAGSLDVILLQSYMLMSDISAYSH